MLELFGHLNRIKEESKGKNRGLVGGREFKLRLDVN
jgi:hypothetical protein